MVYGAGCVYTDGFSPKLPLVMFILVNCCLYKIKILKFVSLVREYCVVSGVSGCHCCTKQYQVGGCIMYMVWEMFFEY